MASYFDASSSSDTSDAATLSDQRPAVATDTWKGKLNFDRACTGPEQRCWLCTELTPWNQAMHGLAFELVELFPGKLRLRSNPQGDGGIERDQATAAAETSFLVSWLLQHHPCIDELKVSYDVHPRFGEKETPFPISLRPTTESDGRRTIRVLELEGHAGAWFSSLGGTQQDCYELEHLDAVCGLESLKLEFSKIKPQLAGELAKLLRRNASSVKMFEIVNATVPRKVNRALRYLFSCESLTIASYHDWCDRLPSMSSVARLMHSSTALKELSIASIASRRQMSTIAKELETNTTLKKLGVHIAEMSCSPEPVFTALRANTTLEELHVSDCVIGGECGRALALLLQKNTGLRVLYIGDVEISDICMIQLSVTLAMNTTLESLHISSERLPTNGIAALCMALGTNKTLKKLQFTGLKCSQEFRAALARRLAQVDCYGRVQLPWTEPDMPGLTAALTSSFASFEEFRLPDIRSMSVTGIKQLFTALASNTCVRTLGIRIKGDPGEKGTALCEMLKVNWSIRCLDLTIDKDKYKFVEEISRALAENVGITKMMLGIDDVSKFETATVLSYLLAHNKTATKFFFGSMTSLYPEFVEEFSQGMRQNMIIVKFGLARNLLCDDASFPFFEAVRRNQGALNRAVDFIVSPSLDRQCAEGFERFAGRPYLLKHLKKVTGKTEAEALLAIAAAERYLRSNYLCITSIVRHSVKCHPAKGTQVDALNKDCWLAIVRHLKIADVLT